MLIYIRNKVVLLASLFLIICMFHAQARNINKDELNWPKQLPTSIRDPYNEFGNSGNSDFYQAATENSKDMTPEELASVENKIPLEDANCWYFELGFSNSDYTSRANKNISKNSYVIGKDILRSAETMKKKNTPYFSVGYMLTSFRFALEAIINKTLEYNPAPIFSGGLPERLNSRVDSKAILFTVAYDFSERFRIRPYISGVVGVSYNQVSAAMSGGVGNGKEKVISRPDLSYGLGVGFRTRIMQSRFFINLQYQIISLGALRWADDRTHANGISDYSVLDIRGSSLWKGYKLGLIYIL